MIILNKNRTLLRMRLMERLDRACRLAHPARSTRLQYARWVEQFLRFHRHPDGSWRWPNELRGADVAAFLTHMAVERRLSQSSQNQALCAIVFLYRQVLRDQWNRAIGKRCRGSARLRLAAKRGMRG